MRREIIQRFITGTSWGELFPSNLTASIISDTQINLSWTNNGTADYDDIRVERRIVGEDFAEIVTLSLGTATYNNTGLVSGTTYVYRVRYKRGLVYSEYTSVVSATTTIATLLADGNTYGWYDSKDLTTITKDAGTGAVSAWNDKLASGRNFVQPTDNRQPIWSTDGITFDGAASNGDFMNQGAITFNNPQVFYIVIKQISWTNLDTFISGSVSNVMRIYQNSNEPQINIRNTTISGNCFNLSVGNLHLLRVAFNGASSHIKVDFINTWQGNTGTSNAAGFVLGANYNNAANSNILVKEMICRYIADSDADELKIYRYLNTINGLLPGVWESRGVVLEETTGDDNYQNTYEPFVLYEDNAQILSGTVFKMWYSHGYGGADMWYAESLDGFTWQTHTSNPVLEDSRCNDIIKVGSTYHLYRANVATTAFDHYTSTDGVSWTLVANNVLVKGSAGDPDDTYINNKSIIIKDGTWYMFYEAYGSVADYNMCYATSADGNTWTKQGSVIGITGETGNPQVKKIGSTYYMWTHGGDLVRYTSSDLITWTQTTTRPIIKNQTADEGVFNTYGGFADHFPIEYNDKVYLFLASSTDGSQASGHYKIKLFIAEMPITDLILTQEGNRL